MTHDNFMRRIREGVIMNYVTHNHISKRFERQWDDRPSPMDAEPAATPEPPPAEPIHPSKYDAFQLLRDWKDAREIEEDHDKATAILARLKALARRRTSLPMWRFEGRY